MSVLVPSLKNALKKTISQRSRHDKKRSFGESKNSQGQRTSEIELEPNHSLNDVGSGKIQKLETIIDKEDLENPQIDNWDSLNDSEYNDKNETNDDTKDKELYN